MQRLLIILGLAVVAIGIFWPWLSRLPFGRLPGDLHFKLRGREFELPIATTVLLSFIAMLIAKLL